MAPFLNYVFVFALGAVVTFLTVKSGPTLKQKRIVKGLKANNAQLEDDKLALQNRKDELVEVIDKNQRKLKENEEAIGILSGQVIKCLELLSSVTRIREQSDMIDREIAITERIRKKYERNSDIYISD